MKRTLVYWRDIPAQVIVQRGRVRERGKLSARFHEAIDRAAMRAGKGGSDAYLAEWRRATEACETREDLSAYVAAELARIEGEYSDARLERLVRAHGVDGA